MSDGANSSPRVRQSRRGRRRVWYAIVLLAALAAAAGIGLSRIGNAGETATPGPGAAHPATPLLTVTSAGGASATPSPTPYPADLAVQTVRSYWDFISRGEPARAYDLLSYGAKLQTTREQFVQGITQLLQATGGLSAGVGDATVTGKAASVTVTLHYIKGNRTVSTSQHVVWEGDNWRIDQKGTASP